MKINLLALFFLLQLLLPLSCSTNNDSQTVVENCAASDCDGCCDENNRCICTQGDICLQSQGDCVKAVLATNSCLKEPVDCMGKFEGDYYCEGQPAGWLKLWTTGDQSYIYTDEMMFEAYKPLCANDGSCFSFAGNRTVGFNFGTTDLLIQDIQIEDNGLAIVACPIEGTQYISDLLDYVPPFEDDIYPICTEERIPVFCDNDPSVCGDEESCVTVPGPFFASNICMTSQACDPCSPGTICSDDQMCWTDQAVNMCVPFTLE